MGTLGPRYILHGYMEPLGILYGHLDSDHWFGPQQPPAVQPTSQRTQYTLSKEDALNYRGLNIMVQGIFRNSVFFGIF